MTTFTLTTDEISRRIWECDASALSPEGSRVVERADKTGRFFIYPDPAGGSVGFEPYLGTPVKGWAAARLEGSETVTVTDTGNVIRFSASPMVLARIGHSVSGREGRKLRESLA